MKTVGERVRYARTQARLNQYELARRIGVKQPTISDLERNESKDTAMLPEIERETGFRATWLRSGRGPQKLEGQELVLAEESAYAEQRPPVFLIPQMDVRAAMGPGAIPADHVDMIRNVAADVNQLRKQCSFTSGQNLRLITGYGESMEPTFVDGDLLLVDIGINRIDVDAIYLFTYDNEMFIKRIQRMPNIKVLRVISDNRKTNDPWDIPSEKMDLLTVHARVILAWNARRL